jgi:hypothetical protein
MAKKKQDKPIKTEKNRYNDKETGKFIEGNPGRPEGSKNKFSRGLLERAIEAEEEIAKKEGGISVFQHFVRMAYREPSVMVALMRKFVPDLEKTEISGNMTQQIDLSGLSTEEIRALAYERKIDRQAKDNGRAKRSNKKSGKN